MNVIDEALDEIAAALDEVLPGRTTATPRTTDVGPAFWIEVPSLTPDRVPSTRHVVADFPVWLTADGADRAQVAMLNDGVAKAFDALARLRLCWPMSSRPASTAPGEPRAVVITVRRILTARGFCLIDPPGEAPIPPDPIDPITPDTESEED